jgi:hypothetical protein
LDKNNEIRKVYSGWISLMHSGCGISIKDPKYLDSLVDEGCGSYALANIVRIDISEFSSNVSVRYFVSNKECTFKEAQEGFIHKLYGSLDSSYEEYYGTEWTGFMYADERLVIGGHDLIKELISYEGKYLNLEIIYHMKILRDR